MCHQACIEVRLRAYGRTMRSLKISILPVIFVSVLLYAVVLRADPAAAAAAHGPGVCDSTGVDVEANGTTTVYATLAEVFAAVNSGIHTGAVRIEVCGNTFEIGTAILNASGSGPASYTSVHISPVGGAARVIESDVGGAAIDLNGADNVTIDGINTDGNSLTITNFATSIAQGTSTILFRNDASNNLITNSNIQGSGTVPVLTHGGVIFFSQSSGDFSGTGNNNNTISFCNIGPAASGTPSKAVYANGSTGEGNRNSGNTITGNNIFDYFLAAGSAGVHIGSGNTAWTVSNNRLYQTEQRTLGGSHEAIRIATNVGTKGEDFQITGNVIGYSASSGTGTYAMTGNATFRGIHISHSSTTGLPAAIQGNTITAIDYASSGSGSAASSPFIAILVGQSAGPVEIGNCTGNTIGSIDGLSNLSITSSTGSSSEAHGILNLSNIGSILHTISNNRIGSITATNAITGALSFWGIRVQANSTATAIVANNSVGSAAGPISINASNPLSRIVGIGLDIATLTPISTVTGNTIRNLSSSAGNTGLGNTASVIGIHFAASSSSGHTIARNTISKLSNSNASAATSVTGINYAGPNTGSNTVERNSIYGLSVASSNAEANINGINIVAGQTTFQNNAIALGNEVIAGNAINGINETAAGTDNFYHNSVFIAGSGTGAGSSFALQSSITTNTRNIRNNILVNTRTTIGGKNYAIRVGGTAANPAGLMSNNNILNAPGAGNRVGLFNGADRLTIEDWRAATGQDSNSFSSDPQFMAPTAGVPDLHIRTTSPAVSQGSVIAGVAADYDNDPRPVSASDIGADEIVQTSGGTVPAGAFYNLSLVDGDVLGGDVSVSGTLNISGIASTGANRLTLGCDAFLSGPAAGEANPNYVTGRVEKIFCGTGTFIFPVGTPPAADPSGSSPVTINVTGGTFPSSLTVSVTDTWLAGLTQSMSVSRYWPITETGDITADLAFNYRQEDVNGDESLYRVFRRTGDVTAEQTPNAVDAVNNIGSVSNVSSFSDWGIGIGVVSAANASLGGRIRTAAGRGVPFAKVTAAGGNLPQPKTVTANAFGYYRFEALPAGQTYFVTVAAKRHRFETPTRIIALDDNVTDADFVAQP